MGAKFKISFDADKSIRKIQSEYIKKAPDVIRDAMIQSMERGESPVKNGEWKTPYSLSYQATINGMVSFRYIGGKIVPLPYPDSIFGFGKKTTPVNLKLSGQLYSDLEIVPRGNSMRVQFKKTSEWLANIHNNLGVRTGKNFMGPLVKRRILPTNDDEDFNSSIQSKMDNLLRSIVKTFIK